MKRIKQFSLKCCIYGLTTISLAGPIQQGKSDLIDYYYRTKDRILDTYYHTKGTVRPLPQRAWQQIADDYADAHKLNRCFVRAVIKVESANCTQMISTAGALGCMQLMPATARSYGIDTREENLDPEHNIYGGTTHISELIRKYDIVKALKVYNAGPNRVDKTIENRTYPEKILRAWIECRNN